MKVIPQCVVALTWTLKDTLDEILDELDTPTEFLVGGRDLLQSLDDALQTHQAGDKLEVQLEPKQAFGDYDEHLIFLEPRDAFPGELEEGMAFEGLPAGCSADAPQDHIFFVSQIYPDHVVLDGNHPLAGIALRLQLRIHHVRQATIDEIGDGTLGSAFFRIDRDDGHQ